MINAGPLKPLSAFNAINRPLLIYNIYIYIYIFKGLGSKCVQQNIGNNIRSTKIIEKKVVRSLQIILSYQTKNRERSCMSKGMSHKINTVPGATHLNCLTNRSLTGIYDASMKMHLPSYTNNMARIHQDFNPRNRAIIHVSKDIQSYQKKKSY